MTISTNGIAELSAQETATAWLVLITVDHPDLDQPIRVTSDTVETISNGNVFAPFPFEVTLPDDVEGRAPQALLKIDNTSLEVIALLRGLASPAEQTLEVVYNSSHAGDTTRIKDVRLLAIKADAADQYAESLASDTTDQTSYQTKVTLTFTPASTGDYLVIANAKIASDANGAAMRARLNYTTGSLAYGDKTWYCMDDWDNQPFAVMEKLNLSNASKTFQLEYRSESGTLCYIEYARILALRLDTFDNHYFASTQNTQNTTQATDQDFLTLTATPLALSHAILAVGAYNTTSTTVSAYLNVAKDGAAVEEWNREAPNSAGWQYAGLAQRATLPAVAATWKWRARAEAAGTTVNVGNLAIAVLQLEATPAAARRRYMALAG